LLQPLDIQLPVVVADRENSQTRPVSASLAVKQRIAKHPPDATRRNAIMLDHLKQIRHTPK
jgi:hypothetical protein